MIKIGDKVKFLNDVGGGIVKGFINQKVVSVENEDGFEIPYPISQLINTAAPELNKGGVSVSNQPTETEPKVEPIIEKPLGEIINGKNSPDFYFCFVPKNEANPLEGDIDLFLVNNSNFTLLFHCSLVQNGAFTSLKNGVVAPNTNSLLTNITQSDLSDLPDYAFQLLYFKSTDEVLHDSIKKVFKINPVKFYKESSFHSNTFFRKRALILQITPNPLEAELEKLSPGDINKVVIEKEKRSSIPKTTKIVSPDEIVIDLHITELLDDVKDLTNREMLEIQLEKVESEMKLAIESRAKRIVFIHGVGQGVLKKEVGHLLSSKFKRYYFQDASFKEYGYGATMVTLRRK